jgi:hypothetical protein
VHEHILAAIITNDEAEALLSVEEFDDAFAFADHLGRHAAATAAAAEAASTAAAAKAAATAAAEAITAATAETVSAASVAAATEAIAAAAETASTIATVTFVTEAVALVLATARTALTSIETHALQFFPNLAPRMKAWCAGRGHNILPAREKYPRLKKDIKQSAPACERFRHEMGGRGALMRGKLPPERNVTVISWLSEPGNGEFPRLGAICPAPSRGRFMLSVR